MKPNGNIDLMELEPLIVSITFETQHKGRMTCEA